MIRSSGCSSSGSRARLSVESSHRVTTSTLGLLAPAEQVGDLVGPGPVAVVDAAQADRAGPAPVAVEHDADVTRAGTPASDAPQPVLVHRVDEVAQAHGAPSVTTCRPRPSPRAGRYRCGDAAASMSRRRPG